MASVAALILCLTLAPGDQTLLTWEGGKAVGTVTLSADTYVVKSASGVRRFAITEVACVYRRPSELPVRADSWFSEAQRLFKEAKPMEESNPIRNRKARLAIERAQGAANLYRLAAPLVAGGLPEAGSKVKQMLQFIKACRGLVSSDRAGATTEAVPEITPLAATDFKYDPAKAGAASWAYTVALGPGQNAIAEDLVNAVVAKRLAAVQRLVHPPSPRHLSTLIKILEIESDPSVIKALGDGLGTMDATPYIKNLEWAKQTTDPVKRSVVFTLVRSASPKEALAFLVDWFGKMPPSTKAERAAFGAAFREFREKAVPKIKALVQKTKSPSVRKELFVQMGLIGDPAFAPALIKALSVHTREALAALWTIGKPAMPAAIGSMRAGDPVIKKYSIWLVRAWTRIDRFDPVPYQKWWVQNHREVEAGQEERWTRQAAAGYAVKDSELSVFEMSLRSIISTYGLHVEYYFRD